MASWPEIRETLERYEWRRVQRLSDDLLVVTVDLVDADGGVTMEGERAHVQRDIYISREVLTRKDGGPGQEYVGILASVGTVGTVDLMSLVGHAGELAHSLLGYVQGTNGGTLVVGTRLPAAFIDISDPFPFLLLLRSIADTARGVISELGTEGGFYAYRAEQVRQSAWNCIRQLIQNDDSVTVEKDFGHGFFFWTDGLKDPGRRFRLFVCQDNRGPGEYYVALEIALGTVRDVDLRRAAEVAAVTYGGVVNHEGLVAIRIYHHLTALTVGNFSTSVLQLVNAAEEYLGPNLT